MLYECHSHEAWRAAFLHSSKIVVLSFDDLRVKTMDIISKQNEWSTVNKYASVHDDAGA